MGFQDKQYMDKRKYIVGAGIVLVIIVVALVFIWRTQPNDSNAPEDSVEHRGIAGDPTDITIDFYSSWLSRRKTTNVSSTTANPLDSSALSYQILEKLKDFDFSPKNTGLDPILCQTALPNGFRTKTIFSKETTEQILVLSSDKQAGGQAAVTLEKNNGLWEITNITCSTGEQAPDVGEFSFDNEGLLLKDSLPATFDKDYWYLIFKQNDEPGHTAPLLLDEGSMCADAQGGEDICKADTFYETMHVHVQGQMTESGVSVKHIETLP